jgi:hypothetical protein
MDILKYLFFLVLGIILYILLNGKDGFSVGIPVCSATTQLNEISARYMVDYYNKEHSFHQNKKDNITQNLCFPYCDDDDEECKEYNTFKCHLDEKKFIRDKDNPNIKYSDTGFEKITGLIELDSIHFHAYELFLSDSYDWLDIEPSEETPILSLEHSLDATTIINGLRFEEYMLKRYLENLHFGYNIKKIMDGIFYINGIIYYFKCEIPYFIRITHNLTNNSLLNGTTNRIIRESGLYNYINAHPGLLYGAGYGSYPVLHIDATNIKYQKTTEDEEYQTPLCDVEIDKSPIELYISDTRRKYDYAHFGIGTENNLLYDMSGNEVSIGSIYTEVFNLWVLLYSNSDIQTLGFIDLVDEHSHNVNQVQETLNQAIGVDDPNYRSNVMSYPNAVLLNFDNINTFEKTGNIDDPTLDLNRLYTFTMKSGDGFRFNTTSAPHTGFNATEENSIRISTESRYILFSENYDLSLDVNALTYMSEEIDNFFIEQYDIANRIHGSLSNDVKKQKFQGTFTHIMFHELMDQIPYQEYFTNRESSIVQYIKL